MQWFHGFIAENITTYHTLWPGPFLHLTPAESKFDVTQVMCPYCFVLFAAGMCCGDLTDAAEADTSTCAQFTSVSTGLLRTSIPNSSSLEPRLQCF